MNGDTGNNFAGVVVFVLYTVVKDEATIAASKLQV